MKKEYEAPKAEKVEFNYSEAVVASRCIKKKWLGESVQEAECLRTEFTDYVLSNEQ